MYFLKISMKNYAVFIYLLFIVLRLALIVAKSGLEHTKHPSLALNSCWTFCLSPGITGVSYHTLL